MAKTLSDFIIEARRKIREIDCDTLEDWMRSRDDVLVVDVREADEYADGHIPGAILVPRGNLEALADPAYPHCHPVLSQARDQTVALYCAAGARSAMAAVTLQEMGFSDVYNLAGGMEVWEAEDKPVEGV